MLAQIVKELSGLDQRPISRPGSMGEQDLTTNHADIVGES